jgi:hypothetical protein
MTITYTNHVKVVSDSFRYLLVTEFNNEIVHAKLFQPDKLTRGEYFRYYLSEQPIVSKSSDGETRAYTFNCSWYFNTKHFDFRKTFDDLVSERIERLKRLMANNNNYIPSGVYKWHMVDVEPAESSYIGVDGDELDSYIHIFEVPITIVITRSDFN